ncbi:hypothetical protein [Periweissella ghanensis]|uniref:HAD family hydrolase n=1 Tax=Periweissella ghanensis TaxID=467997 RepID=A0ABM8ZCD5_9LACO|nr:hypothetical protein [Periweissella ghanensis]MCM0600311.1 hypothetical protein [Periweissella ghanensis]CAH0419223.1 hypothetical protein WGH24286_01670 [Periweissella ghanensis]
MTDIYELASTFHQKFDDRKPERPAPLDWQEAIYRSSFVLEELVEFIATTCPNEEMFSAAMGQFQAVFEQAQMKMRTKQREPQPTLVKQADALGDVIYLSYGTAVLMGLNPESIVAAIHESNMAKLFDDGQVHFDPQTNKVMKPADWEAKHAPEAHIRAAILGQNPHAQLEI